MRKFVITLAFAGVTVAGLSAAPVVYAQEPRGRAQNPQGPDESTRGPDTQRMMKMMEMCGKMMHGGMMQRGMMGAPGSRKPSEN